jgi:nucleotide-binding universal stress UspA family protein
MTVVVVGVDGSEGAIEALRFAVEEARIRGVGVKAVSAWHVPPAAYEAGWATVPLDLDEYRKLAQKSLDQSLADSGIDRAGVEITSVFREGQAADVLCDEAASDDLLVVGSRGLGGFRGLLLGSVSQQVVHHSPCPVVVVPGRSSDGEKG